VRHLAANAIVRFASLLTLGSALPAAAQAPPPTPDQLDPRDGVASIPDRATFEKLSYQGQVRMDTYLNDLQFVKFQIEQAGTDKPLVYFMNTKTHQGHPMFMQAIGLRRGRGGPRGGGAAQDPAAGRQMRGAITYRPRVRAPDGEPGLYTVDYQPNDSFSFEWIKLAHDLLLARAPFLKGKLAYHPLQGGVEPYRREKAEYEKAGLAVYLDRDLETDFAYLPLNLGEACGRLRVMSLSELPGPRDVVLYAALPNELPRVAGIITSVRQTPLSHVNLRAIQDRVPNAYVNRAAENSAIKPLIDKYVHYKVTADGFHIREAASAEVEAHFAALRPATKQTPRRDLTVTEIRKLDDIQFGDAASFGAKTANLAAMRSFGLPEGTVPDGFGVPFHFYDAFLKHNGLYERAAAIVENPQLAQDRGRLESELRQLRLLIVEGSLPAWMTEALGKLQKSFPEDAAIRCRSSTNNEDLPGFSGAGLYDSVTHRPEEGHLSRSIKEVYASLWSLRAFEERDFYRVDHLSTAIGVLVLPSFQDEKSNGVAVTDDILYQTRGNYYLNTQVGEDLVTNPEAQSIPEEILLGWYEGDGFEVRQRSNRVKDGEQILQRDQLDLLRKCLTKIHGKFAKLYQVDRDASGFAMEVEYKITSGGELRIKQARPWVFAGRGATP
jgi:hypothetical protein